MAVLSQGTAALVWFEPSPSGGSGWGRTWRGHLLGLSDPSVSSGFYGLLVTRGRHWSWAGSGYSPPPPPPRVGEELGRGGPERQVAAPGEEGAQAALQDVRSVCALWLRKLRS